MRCNSNPNQISLFDALNDRGSIERERVGGRLRHSYNSIISVENLLIAWREFLSGKRKRKDVIQFSLNLTDNILLLHQELTHQTYLHGSYHAFKMNDPKPRDIHKATVRDRLLHHAVYRILYPYFDTKFIFDSYSCRLHKGTHRAIRRFHAFARKVSHNHTRTVWVLKCDVRKFFANIDHSILLEILDTHLRPRACRGRSCPVSNNFQARLPRPIEYNQTRKSNINGLDPSHLDLRLMGLLHTIINSFELQPNKGLPLGNLTSQLLVNIYMNEFDQYIKRVLKVAHYIRYADDFVILHEDKDYLERLLPKIANFLQLHLKLSLHPDKVFIKTLASGIDFLGWVNFPYHRVLRTSNKHRMFRRLRDVSTDDAVISYLGMLSHGDAYKLLKAVRSEFIK